MTSLRWVLVGVALWTALWGLACSSGSARHFSTDAATGGGSVDASGGFGGTDDRAAEIGTDVTDGTAGPDGGDGNAGLDSWFRPDGVKSGLDATLDRASADQEAGRAACSGPPWPGEVCEAGTWTCRPGPEIYATCSPVACATCTGFQDPVEQTACRCACDPGRSAVVCASTADGGATDAGLDAGSRDLSWGDGAAAAFRSFRVSSAFYLCPATVDCESYTELSADGILHVDKDDDPSHTIYTAVLSAADLSAALAILTDPDLITLLQGPPDCPFVFDASKIMQIDIGDLIIVASVLACAQQPIVAAEDEMMALKQKYIP